MSDSWSKFIMWFKGLSPTKKLFLAFIVVFCPIFIITVSYNTNHKPNQNIHRTNLKGPKIYKTSVTNSYTAAIAPKLKGDSGWIAKGTTSAPNGSKIIVIDPKVKNSSGKSANIIYGTVNNGKFHVEIDTTNLSENHTIKTGTKIPVTVVAIKKLGMDESSPLPSSLIKKIKQYKPNTILTVNRRIEQNEEKVDKEVKADMSSYNKSSKQDTNSVNDSFTDDTALKDNVEHNVNSEFDKFHKKNINNYPWVECISYVKIHEFKTSGYQNNTIQITVTPDFKNKYTKDIPQIEDTLTPSIQKGLAKAETSSKKTKQINKFFDISQGETPNIQFIDNDTNKPLN